MSKSKLRVLTISKPYVAASYRDKFSALAERQDLEIGLICPPAWGAQAFEEKQAETFPIEKLPIRLNGRNHFHTYHHLEKAVRKFSPDVLNIEEEHYSLVTFQAFQVAQTLGIAKLFYTWQNLFKRYPPPFSWIERYIFSRADAAAAGNKEAADILRRKGYQGLLEEIPQMGVTPDRYKPAIGHSKSQQRMDLGLLGEGLWVGFFGRLVEEKGISHLLKAAQQLPSVCVLIAGAGPLTTSLKEEVQALGIHARTHFIPMIPSEMMPYFLQAMDVVCLPSLTRANWKEQFGRILIEAMASGAAVIGSSSGEIPNVIGDAGRIFSEGDPESLKSCLKEFLENKNLVPSLCEKAYKRVNKLYSTQVVADKFALLFHSAYEHRKRQSYLEPRR